MRTVASCVGAVGCALGVLGIAVSSAIAADDPPTESLASSVHVDFDFGLGVSTLRFVSAADVSEELCSGDEACNPPEFTFSALRAAQAVGWGAYSLEASIELPLESGEAASGTTATFGARVETAPDAWLSLHFRMAYVQRLGDYEGQGARFGVGLLLRPLDFAALYGEATGDITTVPRAMNDAGTLFSYGYYFGGGLRLYVGLL